MNGKRTVSIERSADYLYQKAVQNAAQRRYFDASELMRSAVDREPGNRDYQIRLAEMYDEAGYTDKARRLLLDLLAEKGAPVECWYRILDIQCREGNFDGAVHTLRMIREMNADADDERIEHLADEIDYWRSGGMPYPRRAVRAVHLLERAKGHIRDGRFSRAARLLRQSLNEAPLQPEARALDAMCLMLMGRREEALREASAASMDSMAPVRALCVSAQVFAALAHMEEAERCLEAASDQEPTDGDLYLMLLTMSECDMHERIAEETRLALQQSPCDRVLLHMRAVALAHTGAPVEAYQIYWKRILRIDPQDPVAASYLELCSSGSANGDEMTYMYALTETQALAYARRFAESIDSGTDALKSKWRTDEAFRRMVYWAAGCDLEHARQAAVSVLTAIADDEAVSLLRSMLASANTQDTLKMHIVRLARMAGIEDDRLAPLYGAAEAALLCESDLFALARLTVGERQLIRYTADVLEDRYGLDARVPITVMWIGVRRDGMRRNPRLDDTEAICAALSWCFLDALDQRIPLKTLAKLFGSGLRRTEYYRSHIARYLKKYGDLNEAL